MLTATGPVVADFLAFSFGRFPVDPDRGFLSVRNFLAHGPLRPVTVLRMPAHVDETARCDFISEPVIAETTPVVTDRSHRYLFDFVLGQRSCGVWTIARPTRVLLQGLEVGPGEQVSVLVLSDEAWKSVLLQCPADVAFSTLSRLLVVVLGPLLGQKTTNVRVRQKFFGWKRLFPAPVSVLGFQGSGEVVCPDFVHPFL